MTSRQHTALIRLAIPTGLLQRGDMHRRIQGRRNGLHRAMDIAYRDLEILHGCLRWPHRRIRLIRLAIVHL